MEEEKVCLVCGCSLPEGQCTTIAKMTELDEAAAKQLIEQGEILEHPVGAYFRLLNAPFIKAAVEQAEREKAAAAENLKKYSGTQYKQQSLPEGYRQIELEGEGRGSVDRYFGGVKINKWLDFVLYVSMIIMRTDFPHETKTIVIPREYAKFNKKHYNSFLTVFVNETKDEEFVEKKVFVDFDEGLDRLKISVDRKNSTATAFRRASAFNFQFNPANKHLIIDWFAFPSDVDKTAKFMQTWKFTLL